MGVNTGVSQHTDLSTLRIKTFKIESDSSRLDSLLLFPASLVVTDSESNLPLDTSSYQLRGQWLIWKKKLSNTVKVQYRILPFDLAEVVTRFKEDSIRSAANNEVIGFEYNPYQDNLDLIDFKGLNYNGSFARGLSFGNNQNLVLNSSFNLQMSGRLNNDVEIVAAITDENIPLQPEGNTQQLREFDKIFIQLRKDQTQLIAGDYEIQRPESYFMNYFKKLEGATVKHKLNIKDQQTLDLGASVAISRGKFARNQIANKKAIRALINYKAMKENALLSSYPEQKRSGWMAT